MTKPGGQGSSGGGSGGSGGEGDLSLEDLIALKVGDPTRPFGWVGSAKDGTWSEQDFENIDAIVADVTELQTRGEIKGDNAIKKYLNGLMEDGGVTLAQYEALKLYYGI